MNLRVTFICAIVVGLLAGGACRVQKPVQSAKSSAGGPAIDVQPSPGITVEKPACAKDSKEECNGLDDDCNGVIDDNCGYQGGNIQITLAWNTGSDIDLIVADPKGEAVFYNQNNRNTSTGGHMDHDGRGDCRPEQDNPRIENAYWEASRPTGIYKVELNYFGPCGDNAETEATVSIASGGVLIGVYRYTLKPEERKTIATFNVKGPAGK
jgi:hypothetical protein